MLVTSVTHEKNKEIEARIGQNCHLSCYDVALDISLDKSAVHRVLTDVLGLRNVCSVWVPRKLSDQNKVQRVKCVGLFASHPLHFLLSNCCAQDESWVTWTAQPSRRVWIGKKVVKPTTVKEKLTNRKNMILVAIALTCKPKRFSVTVMPQGKTVDSAVMVEYLQITGKSFLSLKNNKVCIGDLLWQLDNARPHTFQIMQDYTTWWNRVLIHQIWTCATDICSEFSNQTSKIRYLIAF